MVSNIQFSGKKSWQTFYYTHDHGAFLALFGRNSNSTNVEILEIIYFFYKGLQRQVMPSLGDVPFILLIASTPDTADNWPNKERMGENSDSYQFWQFLQLHLKSQPHCTLFSTIHPAYTTAVPLVKLTFAWVCRTSGSPCCRWPGCSTPIMKTVKQNSSLL